MTPAELDELKTRPGNSCAEVAGRLGVALRPYGREMMGPCPICSAELQDRTATRWQTKDGGWVCAVCCDGGDVIRLVERSLNRDFRGAVDWLGGATADLQAQQGRQKARQAESDNKAAQAERHRERERTTLYETWRSAVDPVGTPVEVYLAKRGIPLPSWPSGAARLRYVAEMPYVDGAYTDDAGRKSPRVLARLPAMVAPITREGRFSGLQITWLDDAGAKARVRDPDSGEALTARKVRGSKAGAVIELVKVMPPAVPQRLVIGEGTETVLSAWHAMTACGLDLGSTEFWTAVDVGNLGGKAAALVTHPHLKTAKGAARRVPGPDPDLTAPGIVIPDEVAEVVVLGDSDSDRLEVECAIHRAAERFRAGHPDRAVTVAWADAGRDFNDMLRGDQQQ